MQEKENNRNLRLLLIASVSVIVLIACVAALSIYALKGYGSEAKVSRLREMVGESSVELTTDEETGRPVTVRTDEDTAGNGGQQELKRTGILDKYRALYELNPDMAGWISIPDTAIDYPVMQTLYDEEYYLRRNFYGEEDNSGMLFMDSRCFPDKPSTNIIIYGHNMKNGGMFADLLKYEDPEFYEKHRFIRFDTVYEEALYEVVAVFRTRVAYENEDTFRFYNFIEADSRSDIEDYIKNISAMSLYDIRANAITTDYLLTLSTCEYTVDDGRFVVVARKVA